MPHASTRLTLVIAMMAANSASAQFHSSGLLMERGILPSEFDVNARSGNDCWGYVSSSGREYALMGLHNAMAVVEVTDPRQPRIVETFLHQDCTWADIKVYRHYAYVANDCGGGIQIIDLSDVDAGNVELVNTFGASPHNIAIDETSGFLYTCDSRSYFYDLSDPPNPLEVGWLPGPYLHDAHAVTYTEGAYAGRQILFGAHGDSGIYIWDVTDKADPVRLAITSYPGRRYTHQLWTSDDRRYLFVDDELTYTPGTRVLDISDLTNPVYLTLVSSGLAATDHNVYYNGGFVFQANYKSGLRIFDVADPLNAVETAWFDTYPLSDTPGFSGAWSVYPYFPSGTLIVSDINRGLFVLSPEDLIFDFPEGRPDRIDPASATAFSIDVLDAASALVPDSVALHVNDGFGWRSAALSRMNDGRYKATLPAMPCGGSIRYYVTALAQSGRTVSAPHPAPDRSFHAISARQFTTLHEEHFDEGEGWTVDPGHTASGAWELGAPDGSGFGGDPQPDFDGFGKCFTTGVAGGDELNSGPTIFYSPVFDDLAGREHVQVTFARWFYNEDRGDQLQIFVSNDGGKLWTLMRNMRHAPEWTVESMEVADYLPITSAMQFKFSVADTPPYSLTEAAIDDFRLLDLECPPNDLHLSVTGECDPQIRARFEWTGARHRAELGLLFADRAGQSFVPSGQPCPGTRLGLRAGRVEIARRFDSGDGSGFFNAALPPRACGGYFQLIQPSNCETSNVAQAPN